MAGWRGKAASAICACGCKDVEITGSCGGCSAIPAAEGGCKALGDDCKAWQPRFRAVALRFPP
ncbi:unnamed protein product [Prunus armeniaca]